MRRIGILLFMITALLLVPVGSSAAYPPALPEAPEYSPRCEKQAFDFAEGGHRPAQKGSLTRVRLVVVQGFMDRDCAPRKARAAIFDRKAGTRKVIQASQWTKWTTQRRFVRYVNTTPYPCGHYRTVYIQVWYYDVVRTFISKGVRGC